VGLQAAHFSVKARPLEGGRYTFAGSDIYHLECGIELRIKPSTKLGRSDRIELQR